MWRTALHLAMVEHEVLKAKLRKEFNRLGIRDEELRDAMTAELSRLAEFFIESHTQEEYERPIQNPSHRLLSRL